MECHRERIADGDRGTIGVLPTPPGPRSMRQTDMSFFARWPHSAYATECEGAASLRPMSSTHLRPRSLTMDSMSKANIKFVCFLHIPGLNAASEMVTLRAYSEQQVQPLPRLPGTTSIVTSSSLNLIKDEDRSPLMFTSPEGSTIILWGCVQRMCKLEGDAMAMPTTPPAP